MQGDFRTVQRQGTVSEKQLSRSVVHLEPPWVSWEKINSESGTPQKRGPSESSGSQLYKSGLQMEKCSALW